MTVFKADSIYNPYIRYIIFRSDNVKNLMLVYRPKVFWTLLYFWNKRLKKQSENMYICYSWILSGWDLPLVKLAPIRNKHTKIENANLLMVSIFGNRAKNCTWCKTIVLNALNKVNWFFLMLYFIGFVIISKQ